MKPFFNKEVLKGWENHVNIYHSLIGKNTKKSKEKLTKTKNILRKLHKERKKLSMSIFNEKYCKNMTGSTNLTSDYDLTLFLKVNDTQILDKFLDIINQYQNNQIDISKIYDMNFYFSEILCDKISPKSG